MRCQFPPPHSQQPPPPPAFARCALTSRRFMPRGLPSLLFAQYILSSALSAQYVPPTSPSTPPATQPARYETNSHYAISVTALANQHCVASHHLAYLFMEEAPNGLNTRLSRAFLNHFTLTEHFGRGAINEDDGGGARYRKHFYNPIDNTGLIVPLAPAQRSSLSWAFAPTSDNSYSWHAARHHYYQALTAPTARERQLALASLFYSLGHIAHLLQDCAQPQHTRNDPHVPGIDGAPYEQWVSRNFGDPSAYSSMTIPPPAAVFRYHTSSPSQSIPKWSGISHLC